MKIIYISHLFVTIWGKRPNVTINIKYRGVLCQVILHLPFDRTHAQQVSRKVSVIQGQYLLDGLISLWAVIQAW